MKIVKQSVKLEAYTLPSMEVSTELTDSNLWNLSGGDSPSALIIERAARTCYKSEGKIESGSAAKLVKKLAGMHHDAMLEFVDATFRIVCDRGVSHEIVRHRIASYAQESTRYCNYSKDQFGKEITVICPPGIEPENPDGSYEAWSDAMLVAERTYFGLLDHGFKPQIARSVLPTCLKTEICVKMNFRNWLHFLELRTSPAAHPQMREVATMIGKELKALCPEVFA